MQIEFETHGNTCPSREGEVGPAQGLSSLCGASRSGLSHFPNIWGKKTTLKKWTCGPVRGGMGRGPAKSDTANCRETSFKSVLLVQKKPYF